MGAFADEDVITGVRNGNADVFAAFFREHYAPLRRFAHSLVNDSDRADDVVQEVFATIWAGHASWSPSIPLAAYLFRAVRNRAIERFRRDALTGRVHGESQSLGMGATAAAPDAIAEANDLEEKLARVIRALPERQRTAVLLRWHYSLNPPAIAEVLGITSVAVRKLLDKAEVKLRAVITE